MSESYNLESMITGNLGTLSDPLIWSDLSRIVSSDGYDATVNLQRADISRYMQGSVTASNASFWSSLATECEVRGGWFMNCTFQDSSLTDVTFSDCVFTGCWFDSANLTRVRFHGGQLDGSMHGASLTNVHFDSCELVLGLREVAIDNVLFKDLSIEELDVSFRSVKDLQIVNVTGTPLCRGTDGHNGHHDFQAFVKAGWHSALATDSDDVQWGHDDRIRRMREINEEFGDETENWYHKWMEGLIDD